MQSSDWLDPETQSILCKSPPAIQTATAVDAKGYSLLLVKAGHDQIRAIQVVSDIQRCGARNATNISIVIAQTLTLYDAMAGQFALSCCDSISAFVADDIVYDANADYLQQLSEAVMSSSEFELVTVRLISIPSNDLGRRFSAQFLGLAVGIATPSEIEVYRKKSRLMMHWAPKCDVHLEVKFR